MKKTPRIVFFQQVLVILLLFFCLIKEGYSQSFAGRLVGSVRDPEGAVIGGISIVIENEATGIKREVVSSDNGNFVVPELPPGYYSISIDSENFASTTRKQVKIDVGVETQLELNLQVRASQQVIIITGATAPVLQSSSSQLTETINNQQIDGLPLNGRDFRRLTTLVPGVSPRSPRGSLGSLTVNGQREKANIFLRNLTSFSLCFRALTVLTLFYTLKSHYGRAKKSKKSYRNYSSPLCFYKTSCKTLTRFRW